MENGDKNRMILLVNVCKEKLHYFEFVKPIEDILCGMNLKFFTKHYSEMGEKDLEKAEGIIICGTSLKDNDFMRDVERFSWIRKTEKPVLGICAGMQIISFIFGGKIKKKSEIGFCKEEFEKPFLGLANGEEVYHLHNYYVSVPENFESFTKNKIPQAIKHRSREIYGVLFHPEVRQKQMIVNFLGGN